MQENAVPATILPHMQLHGLDRVIYYGPTLFVAWLAGLCGLLTLVALLFTTLPNPAPIVGAGVFGMLVTFSLCGLLYRAQTRELRYRTVATTRDAALNYALLLAAAQKAGWTVAHSEPAVMIEARVAGSLLTLGEMIVARFRGTDVLLAAISDPRVGFSITGRERCRQHLLKIINILQGDQPAPGNPEGAAQSASGSGSGS